MAKQIDSCIVGTYGYLTCYKMGKEYYVRSKSSLTGKRFRKEKAFEASRRSAERFAEGNRLASEVYRNMEQSKRKYGVFVVLKKRAILLLKEGKDREAVKAILTASLQDRTLLVG